MTTDTTPEETQARVDDRRKMRPRAEVAKKLSTIDRLEIEYVSVNSIYPNPYNPNRQKDEDFELLLLSIKQDGFTQPILIGVDNMIIDGEHRWLAALTLEYEEVPVVRVDMGEMQRKIATIRHNTARGTHDVGLEAEIFKGFRDIGKLDFLAENLDMTEDALDELISNLSGPAPLTESTSIDAWIPATLSDDEAQLIDVGSIGGDLVVVDDGRGLRATTGRAVAYHKRQQQRLDALTNEEDKMDLRSQIRGTEFQVTLVFRGNDGEVVKEVFGEEPAETLLDLCIADLGQEKVEATLMEYMQKHKWDSYDEYLELRKMYNTSERYSVDLPLLGEQEVKV